MQRPETYARHTGIKGDGLLVCAEGPRQCPDNFNG